MIHGPFGIATYGRIPDDLIDCWSESTNASFCSVANPIGRERLMWRGRGAPRPLVKKEWILPSAAKGGFFSFNADIKLFSGTYSAADGYPQLS